ncbi:MAG: hypothetical protein FVQ83_00715 [Chloroflexi bacterium]|nr:hypothetical protein [Chloroflexota bacterium]
MEEPSVLDYFKALLTPWRGKTPEIPPLPDKGVVHRVETQPRTTPDAIDYAGFNISELPWRVLTPLILALLAQNFLGPPRPALRTGVIIYLIALAGLIWANLRGELRLPSPRESKPLHTSPSILQLPLRLGIGFSTLVFLAFVGNKFTSFNVLIWGIAIWYMVLAFWVPNTSSKPRLERLRDFLANPSWNIKITRWTLLVVAAIGISIFFRTYRLTEIPPEMVSDHAETIQDVYDILQGETSIFFPRNSGREPLHYYFTAALVNLFNSGLNFDILKVGTILAGLLMLPYMYLLGKEVGNRNVGFLALLITGIAYWPNVLARVDLRIILYPAFAAPTLFYLLRGIRTTNRNDFIKAGIALGLGLHGYTPFRIVPIVVLIGIGLFLLHKQSQGLRRQTIISLGILSLISLVIFLPLLRYSLENPEMFSVRAFSRLGSSERSLPDPALDIFLQNFWDALWMMNYTNSSSWVVSIPGRPMLDLVSASLFLMGCVLLLARYFRKLNWVDLFLVISVPLLMMPSILSLAFPEENPTSNRSAGALVPVFLIVALALECLLRGIKSKLNSPAGTRLAWGIGIALFSWSATINYGLTFDQYYAMYVQNSWNTSEMGEVIGNFANTVGHRDQAWVMAKAHWVDNRLVGIEAGFPNKNYEMFPENLETTLNVPGPKIFLVKFDDPEALKALEEIYPLGVSSLYESQHEFKDFFIFFVPGDEG